MPLATFIRYGDLRRESLDLYDFGDWLRMRKLVYDVAVTLDGFIARDDGSVDGFLTEGEHATDYQQRLAGYDMVVMGRKTYEFGYRFGLVPGRRAYRHMRHYIVSRGLRFDADAEVDVVAGDPAEAVRSLKQTSGSAIYLCGGGLLAGFLLDCHLIDQLILKVNPVVFGRGVRLFGASERKVNLTLRGSRPFGNGVVLMSYDIAHV